MTTRIMVNSKHAFLIMAHNNPHVLETLLQMIDDERNDIFLHIDKKSKSISLDAVENSIRHSQIHIIKSLDCRWGEFSLVKCELALLKSCLAAKREYDYIHLISGVDLPLKNQNDIHLFFDEHAGEQFINIENMRETECIQRMKYFIPPVSSSSVTKFYIKVLNWAVQHRVIDRLKINYVKTSQWFSITEECAKYIVANEHRIRKIFNYSDCPDELFLGTILRNTKFWNQLSNCTSYTNSTMTNMRYISWNRGVSNHPYTFTNNDRKELCNSKMLFARKFSDDEFDIALYVKHMVEKSEE